jgi:hypothetical protein
MGFRQLILPALFGLAFFVSAQPAQANYDWFPEDTVAALDTESQWCAVVDDPFCASSITWCTDDHNAPIMPKTWAELQNSPRPAVKRGQSIDALPTRPDIPVDPLARVLGVKCARCLPIDYGTSLFRPPRKPGVTDLAPRTKLLLARDARRLLNASVSVTGSGDGSP